MKQAFLLVSLALLVSSCGSTQQTPSVLQRFSTLEPRLSLVGREANIVSIDMAGVGNALKHSNGAGASYRAAILGRNARRFRDDSGATGNRVWRLARDSKTSYVTRYLKTVHWALTWQWWEGQTLARIGALVHYHPWLSGTGEVHELAVLVRRAQGYARLSVASVQHARQLRSRDPHAFQYVPVK